MHAIPKCVRDLCAVLVVIPVCAAAAQEAPSSAPAPHAQQSTLPARSLLGKPFASITSKDIFTGQPILIGKSSAQALLIDFWSSDSEAYAAALVHIRKAYETYPRERFEIVGVSIDSDVDKAKSFIKAHKMTWLHIVEGRGLRSSPAARCEVRSAPMMYLLDSGGRVVWESADASGLAGAVQRQLQRKPTAQAGILFNTTARRPTERDAAAELTDAKRLESARKYYEARRSYRAVVRKYPNGASAKYAQARIAAFQTDQSIAAEIVRQEQRRKNAQNANLGRDILRMAKILIDQKKHALARKMLQRVIDNHPGSPEARESAMELEKLPKTQDP